MIIKLKNYVFFDDINKDRYDILEFNDTTECTFKMISYVISLKLKKTVNISKIKSILITKLLEYKNYSDETWKKMRYVYWLTNRTNIYDYNNSSSENIVDTYDIETIVMNEGYYLTEFELLLIAEHFNIRIVLVKESKRDRHFALLKTGNIIVNPVESDKTIVILFTNYINLTKIMVKLPEKKIGKENIVPTLGLLQYNGDIFINSEMVEEMIDKNDSITYKMPNILDLLEKSYEKFLIFTDIWRKTNSKKIRSKVMLNLKSKPKLLSKLKSKTIL